MCLHRDWQAILAQAVTTIEKGGGGGGDVGGVSTASGEGGVEGGGEGEGECAAGECVAGGPRAGCPPLDCFLLDGLFVTGEASAEYGWLGPPQEGPHRAEGVAFSDACEPSCSPLPEVVTVVLIVGGRV